MVCVDDDPARARDLARPWLTIYMGGMGAKGKNFYVDAAERAGFGDSAREVQRLFIEGDRAGAAAALSDELIESNSVCTDMAGAAARIAEFERPAWTPCSRCRSATIARRSPARSPSLRLAGASSCASSALPSASPWRAGPAVLSAFTRRPRSCAESMPGTLPILSLRFLVGMHQPAAVLQLRAHRVLDRARRPAPGDHELRALALEPHAPRPAGPAAARAPCSCRPRCSCGRRRPARRPPVRRALARLAVRRRELDVPLFRP